MTGGQGDGETSSQEAETQEVTPEETSEEGEAETEGVEEETPVEATFQDRELPFMTAESTGNDTLTLRYYDNCPNVPYIGLARYMDLVFGEPVQVAVEGGKATLTSADGGVVVVDDGEDTITSESWLQFRNYLEPMQAGELSGFIDFATPFARIEDITYEKQTKPVVFDFGSYGIDLHVGEDDVYLPLATASDLMADVAMNSLAYNGREVVFLRGYEDSAISIDNTYYEPISQDGKRPQDMIDFAYGELCFAIDHLYGRTGTGTLDEAIGTDGLDATLETRNDYTRKLRSLLLSEDKADYLTGMGGLDYYLLDFHTSLYDYDFPTYAGESDVATRFQEQYQQIVGEVKRDPGVNARLEEIAAQKKSPTLSEVRDEYFKGIETYHESGDVAMISIDDFMSYDEDGWWRYYNGKGERPGSDGVPDIVGTLLDGIERAQSNPAIKYVIIDVSLNGGGSNDLGAACAAIVAGTSRLHVRDLVTGDPYLITYDIDSLFDGSFLTDAAAESHRNLKFCVLTSVSSFSCGNLFPSLMKDAGLPIIGERSGGGTNMVWRMFTPEGYNMQLSGGTFTMCNDRDQAIEDGVPVDYDLIQYDSSGKADYHAFYDLDFLSHVMAQVFGVSEADVAA